MKRTSLLKFIVLIFIIFCAVFRSWHGTQLDSFTVDEPYHVVAGVSYVKTGDFRLNPEHPPLTKLWVGLFNQSTFKLRPFEPLNDKFNERNYTEEIMYEDNDFLQAQKLSRWAMWSFNGILMLCLLVLVWNLIGFHAAWFLGVLLVLEPTVTAHMPVVMTDLPVALALACCVLAAVGVVRSWNFKWYLILSTFSAIALATKFSAITGLLGIYTALGVVALWSSKKHPFKIAMKRLGWVLVTGLLAVVLLWSSYGFQYHAGPDGSDGFNRTLEQKINDLASPHFQQTLTTLDDLKVLPKAYTWGLADTIRAGIEGRGQARHFIWGTEHKGAAPWFYWPSILLSKIPVAMQLLIMISLLFWCYWMVRKLSDSENCTYYSNLRPVVAMLTVLLVAYVMTLLSSQGTYAGIRHALPLVLVLLVFCALVYQFFHNRPVFRTFAVMLLVASLLMTMSEKRLWEYHNEWVGGTENAYQYFYNEGLDLGQRTRELTNYVHEHGLTDEEFYIATWLIKEEIEAAGVKFSNVAKDIYDDNTAGKYAGYHVDKLSIFLKWEHWDPKEIDHWERVQRLGNIYLFKGSVEDPEAWAYSMSNRIREHLMESSTPDWATMRLRLIEMTAIIDYNQDWYVQLANANIKTNHRQQSIVAYQKALELIDPSQLFKQKIEQQIERLKTDAPLSEIQPLRSNTLE